MATSGGGRGPGINSNHVRALYAAAVAVDRLLGDVEALATSADSPFRRYVDDLTAVQKQVLVAFTRAAHVRMTDALAHLGVPAPAPSGSARASARNALTFADVALQEVEPSRLRGYGPLAAEAEAAIERMLADVAAVLTSVREFLAEPPEVDLAQRIARLDDRVAAKGELTRLERTVREGGLVALRRPLQALVEQVESGTYEIAVFGRVSSGKSSLLNAVLERAVLPVGITPVTSVPTRLVWGPEPGVIVRFAVRGEEQYFPVEELDELVTEERNPGNGKGVVRVVVELPAERLRGGVALVDTPGLGALASAGARQTYAYMPRCDLGVVVVDGGGGFDSADVDLARTLIDSGIEVEIVISKADRASEADRASFAAYVHEQLLGRLRVEVKPRWVSSVEPHTALARAWFDEVLAPRVARSRELAVESVTRKLQALRALVERASGTVAPGREARSNIERVAGEAARYLDVRRRALEDASGRSHEMTLDVIRSAADELAHGSGRAAHDVVRAAMLARADREQDQARRALLETRDRLRLWIDESSRAVGFALEPEIVFVDLTDMPAVEPPPELHGLTIERPRLAPYRERRIAEKLAERSGDAIEASFRRFEQELRAWVRSSFDRLRAQLASQIDPIRTVPSAPAGTTSVFAATEPSGVHKLPEE